MRLYKISNGFLTVCTFVLRSWPEFPRSPPLQYLNISYLVCPAGRSQTHPPTPGILDELLFSAGFKTASETKVQEAASMT